MQQVTNWIGRAILVFLYVPIVAVVVYSFNASPVSYRWDGLSLHWYQALLHNDGLLSALRVSVVVGVVSATLATLIGLLAATALSRVETPGRKAFLAAIFIPLIVPEIVLGVALLSFFSTLDTALGMATLVGGHVVITLPMTTLILLGAMSTMDRSLVDAAFDLGCTPLGTFRRILLPLMWPAIAASWLLSFTTSFGNIVMSTFTNGVGSTTLPLRVYSLLKSGLTPEINALGSLLILATLAIVLAVGIKQMRQVLLGSGRPGDQ